MADAMHAVDPSSGARVVGSQRRLSDSQIDHLTGADASPSSAPAQRASLPDFIFGVAFLGLIVCMVALLFTGAIFGWRPEGDAPVWAGVISLLLVMIVLGSLMVAWTGAEGLGFAPFALWLAIASAIAWFAPPIRAWFEGFLDLAQTWLAL